MKGVLHFSRSVLLGTILLGPVLRAADPSLADKEAAYAQAIEQRSSEIIEALKLKDPAKVARVKARIIAFYRTLNDWQATHEARLQELRRQDTQEARTEIATIRATRVPLRDSFVEDLTKDLGPDDIVIVKNKLTFNAVQVIYDGYIQMLPAMTEEQKTKIYAWLVEARDEAIVGISASEKSRIFNLYRGRINNYLSKEGYDLQKATQAWRARNAADSR